MPFPSLVYRDVKGSNLSSAEGDGNTRNLDGRIAILEATLPDASRGITEFRQDGDQFTVVMTDATEEGPFTLPTANFTFRDAWVASRAYAVNDFFSVSGQLNTAVYQVIFAHTSRTMFDANANDGLGHNFYKLWFSLSKGSSVDEPVLDSNGLWNPEVGDEFKFWVFRDGAPIVLPSNDEQPFEVGIEIEVVQVSSSSSGNVSFIWQSGIDLRYKPDKLAELNGDGAGAILKKIGTDEWVLVGDLASAP